MARITFWLAMVVAAALVVSGPIAAATSIVLSRDAVAGTPIVGDVSAAPGEDVELHCFIDSNDAGNTFEIMVGYDTSSAPSYGAGNPSDHITGNLALVSTKSAISSSIAPAFNVIRSSAYPGAAVVLNASARENPNSSLAGRPFGFTVMEGKTSNAAPGKVKCFSFTLKNQMLTDGQSQYVVVSSVAGANSYSTAWKHGVALNDCSYAIRIVTADASRPIVGTTNKAVFDAVAMGAIPNYIWVLWGRVSDVSAGGFKINDGSGVEIAVAAAGHGLAGGEYVAVKGTLNVDAQSQTAVLTSQQITTYPQN